MEETQELVVIKNGVAELTDFVSLSLRQFKEIKQELEDREKEFRNELLNAMISNNIYSTTINEFTISQVCPKDTLVFDTDSFMLNENIDIIDAMTTTEESSSFDMETFIKECPEIYAKYLKKEYTTKVDTTKLEKTFPDIYKKYATFIKSDKAVTLRVAESKKKK